jgi:hypothetical protein
LHHEILKQLETKCVSLTKGARAGLMSKLTDLGFSKSVIAETVVSTYDKETKPNAAPMGILMEDEQHLAITLFNSSTTFSNIKANRCAVVNLTSNIEIFYKTAFKEANPAGKLPLDWFEKAEGVNAPRLCLADASIEVSVEELLVINAQKTSARFKLEMIQAAPKYPQVHSRAMSQTLEAIIHATRVRALANDETQVENAKHLFGMIDDCNKVVSRVAPNSLYTSVMADLMQRIDEWR